MGGRVALLVMGASVDRWDENTEDDGLATSTRVEHPSSGSPSLSL